MVWYLVLMGFGMSGASPGISTVPTYFRALNQCEDAGKAWDKHPPAYTRHNEHVCLPVSVEGEENG